MIKKISNDVGFTNYEGKEFLDNLMQSKGGKARHKETGIIKLNVIKLMFLHIKGKTQESKVSRILEL